MRPHPFAQAGALSAAYDAVDWAATPLGAVDDWSPALRSAVDLTLSTRFPVTLLWGPELVLVYNQGYTELIDAKHPRALGSRCEDIFPEAWEVIGPMLRSVLETGVPTWVEDTYLPLQRSTFLEECYFTFSYSPVRGEDGRIEGILDISVETTGYVITRRRLAMLAQLSDALSSAEDDDTVAERAATVLATDPADLPQVEIRLPGEPVAGASPFGPAPAITEGVDLHLDTEGAGRVAWLPLSLGGMLVVRLSEQLEPTGLYLDFLRLIAANLGETLIRLRSLGAERDLSAALQRALLSRPAGSLELDLAVRYVPASDLAQVGGDWYDAFLLPDGSQMLAIGDVAGHDQRAAAAMAQLRNLVRGVAHTLPDATPAAVLSGLDRAIHGLEVEAVATALLVRVDRSSEEGARPLQLTWSNAGHPAPLVLEPDGSVHAVDAQHDVLLGVEPSTPRRDLRCSLAPGASLLLYTDGLVERRDATFDEGVAWLQAAVAGRQDLTAAELSDHVIGQLGQPIADDIALLVVRAPQ
ncbi:SpoIIE family protein phosphatase [Nocardioides sp.]|uniref:PP2C family protein-serine/threonine phosphatase n=1 Tax=Nocardioides sp. TaxID=35761 RepID=UPI00286C4780|nr:SpoIIE family protein phosphatase [Nocardioides sp.]